MSDDCLHSHGLSLVNSNTVGIKTHGERKGNQREKRKQNEKKEEWMLMSCVCV